MMSTSWILSFNPLGGGAGSGSLNRSMLTQLGYTWFQSPRRWGGVGLLYHVIGSCVKEDLGFNPLGGGAGSGSEREHFRHYREYRVVSIPSEVGRGQALSGWRDPTVPRTHYQFQSPRRWGGVRLQRYSPAIEAQGLAIQSPRRWGVVRLRRSGPATERQRFRLVSIPSEVGRGQALVGLRVYRTCETTVSIPSEVGRGQAPRA